VAWSMVSTGQSADRFTELAYRPAESRFIERVGRQPTEKAECCAIRGRRRDRCLVNVECGLLQMGEASRQYVALDQARANYKDRTRTHMVSGRRVGIQAHSP